MPRDRSQWSDHARTPQSWGRTSKSIHENCTHLDAIKEVTPSADGCEECLKMGDSWIHLRICLTCGHVGCCDQSRNKHATKHFHAADHPIIQSFQPDEDWLWCYVDEVFMDEPPVPVRIHGVTEP